MLNILIFNLKAAEIISWNVLLTSKNYSFLLLGSIP